MFDQQKTKTRIRGFVNRLKFRIANWLLKPFNLMIVSATDFRSIRYINLQVSMYIERSGALPNRLKAKKNLRSYMATQKRAIDKAVALSPDPMELDNMPPQVAALAQILQEAEKPRREKSSADGTNLATTDDVKAVAGDMAKVGEDLKSVLK